MLNINRLFLIKTVMRIIISNTRHVNQYFIWLKFATLSFKVRMDNCKLRIKYIDKMEKK